MKGRRMEEKGGGAQGGGGGGGGGTGISIANPSGHFPFSWNSISPPLFYLLTKEDALPTKNPVS